MSDDLVRSLAGLFLFPLLALVPGYVAAWLTNLFSFRQRTVAFQLTLSVPLSISICPILVYLVGRFGSMKVVWAVLGVLWLCFLMIAARHFRSRTFFKKVDRPILALVAIWTVLAISSLIDLQWSRQVYFSTVALDYSVRTEFIHSITTTGIPPANPFFFPGHLVPLRYHYLWLLICSLVEQAGGSWVGPRAAWIAGAVWCGFGLIALVALYFRLIWYQGTSSFRGRALLGISLLAVTGLDIIPNLGLWVLYRMGMQHAIQASGDWWNEQVAGFLPTALWEAHYLCALICCLTAFLILWAAPAQQSAARRILYSAMAAVALASAIGSAIYVAFVFAVFLMLWTLYVLWKRLWWEMAVLAIAGIAAILLFLPYAQGLRGSAAAGPPLQVWVRPFSPVDALLRGVGSERSLRLHLLNALLLPLNYFLELGFFFAAAVVWWRSRRRTGKPLARHEIAIALMVATSVVICTFVRSSVIGNNDLGWRGFLIAQFGLLLWSVDVLREKRTATLTLLVALGVLGNIYDVLMLRFYPVLADAAVVSPAGWISPDRHAGERTYAARETYEWAAQNLPASAKLQFNPRVILQDTSAFLYSNRQIVAGDEGCLTGFGGDAQDCQKILEPIHRLYPDAEQIAPASIDGVCRSLPIDLLVAKDLDAVWRDRESWVWKEKPAFANKYFRIYTCPSRLAGVEPLP